MAVAGFKIAVNHCIRPFQDVALAIYTDLPLAHIKCSPEKSDKIIISGQVEDADKMQDTLETGIKEYLEHINKAGKKYYFEIKVYPKTALNSEHLLISLFTAMCTSLNEWLHHPIEKNELLAWLIDRNNFADGDIISACMYGGLMSHLGTRPFRIYQPKGLFFQIESITDRDPKPLSSSFIPLFILALERSDYSSIHEILYSSHPVGSFQDSFLGVLDLPNGISRLHIYNISTPEISNINLNIVSNIFGIDSQGCIVS